MTPWEWTSAALTLAMAAVCLRRRDVRWISLFLLVYAVLYFVPSARTLFEGADINEIVKSHYRGSSTPIKVQALLAIGLSGLALWASRGSRSLNPQHKIVASMIALFGLGLWMEWTGKSMLPLINVVGLSLMLGFVAVGASAWERVPKAVAKDGFWASFTSLTLILLFSSVAFAAWEISNDKAWARFTLTSGLEIQRASSFLFNPNLYGLWCSVLAIVYAWMWHADLLPGHGRWLLAGIATTGTAIFLSASRSTGYLLLLFFVSSALLLPKGHRGRWLPLIVYLVALLASSWLSIAALRLVEQSEVAIRFGLLGLRVLEAPIQLFSAIVNLPLLPHGEFSPVTRETELAFMGRFRGEGRDSGWLTAFDDAGILGIGVLAAFWAGLAYLGLKAYLSRKNVYTAYALSVVGYGIVLGVFMRYQVFPVWLFLAVLLAPCLALWRATSKPRLEAQA